MSMRNARRFGWRFTARLSWVWPGTLALATALAASLTSTQLAAAQGAPRIAQIDARNAAVIACVQLRKEDFTHLPGAPAAILSAQVVAATARTQEYCDVEGYVQPQVQFELRLPTKTWNGRYLQEGCGGLCGTTMYIGACTDALARNFAVGAGNMGHVGDFLADPLWGSDPQLRRDYGKRSPHVVAVAAKAILDRYYGARAAYSYFRGCSTGGREGLSEAQNYPGDFDGIVAGDPAFPARLTSSVLWNTEHLYTANGGHVLSDQKIALLHRAVLKECDANDGAKDGILSNPRDCTFRVASLACRAGQAADECLNVRELRAAEGLYGGVRDSSGRRLSPGGAELGSELAWYKWVVPSLTEGYLRYLAFDENPPPSYDYRDFNFDKDVIKLEKWARVYDPVAPHQAPDLRAFEKHGGKLIEYVGWADPAITPAEVLDYYAQVTHREGGLNRVKQWYRIYLVPGMFHCSGGDVPDQFDVLTAMMAWVEQRKAPDRIEAVQLNAGKAVRSRPLFPYPTSGRYSGSGDGNDAQNWLPVTPTVKRDDRVKWIWAPTP